MRIRNTVAEHKAKLQRRFEALKAEGLSLDMTRGKPCDGQLKLSEPMLRYRKVRSKDGVDCRNYGSLFGLPEARALCGRYLGAREKETVVGGNSSLEMMFNVLAAKMRDLAGWRMQNRTPIMLCPSPGYDRHFTICELLGIKMVPITMEKDGPCIDEVLRHMQNPDAMGMWCVPRFSNPDGVVYSDAIVHALASLKPKCPVFMLMWDNAYAVHDLVDGAPKLLNIFDVSRTYGTLDRVFAFGSFSKVTFAGAGLSMASMGTKNLVWFLKSYEAQTIGSDKLNQLRHVRFLKNIPGIKQHMRKHRRIIAPKFKAANEVLRKALRGKGIAHWSIPQGGYFISFYMERGSAKRTIQLAKELGVRFTEAGKAFPYGHDPKDSHIRIAPTFPTVAEIQKAMEVLALCAQIAHWEKWPQEKAA